MLGKRDQIREDENRQGRPYGINRHRSKICNRQVRRRICEEMGFNTSSPIKFAFFFSLSFALASHSTASFPNFSIRNLNLRRVSSLAPSQEAAVPKATASDLLALLGTKQQASAITAREAQQLRACFKFLVPFAPRCESSSALGLELSGSRSRQEEDELVWWPPEPVMELARLAVDSGGDPGSIHRALDPTVIPVSSLSCTFLSKGKRIELISLWFYEL